CRRPGSRKGRTNADNLENVIVLSVLNDAICLKRIPPLWPTARYLQLLPRVPAGAVCFGPSGCLEFTLRPKTSNDGPSAKWPVALFAARPRGSPVSYSLLP